MDIVERHSIGFDTFQKMLIARQASVVIRQCIRNRPGAPWGGAVLVGPRAAFVVHVVGETEPPGHGLNTS